MIYNKLWKLQISIKCVGIVFLGPIRLIIILNQQLLAETSSKLLFMFVLNTIQSMRIMTFFTSFYLLCFMNSFHISLS